MDNRPSATLAKPDLQQSMQTETAKTAERYLSGRLGAPSQWDAQSATPFRDLMATIAEQNDRNLNQEDEQRLLETLGRFSELTAQAIQRRELGEEPYTPESRLELVSLVYYAEQDFKTTLGTDFSGFLDHLDQQQFAEYVTQSQAVRPPGN